MGFAVVVGTLDISNTPIILQRNVIFGGIFIEIQQDATIRKIDSENTQGKRFPTEVSTICVVPV